MTAICERFDTLGLADSHRTYRLGIMGGTFDPIHQGHLVCAEQTREAFDLDAVVFIPTCQPVFKRGQRIAPAHHRLEMCRLATLDNPYFDVSSLEIDRGGDTYTVDTLRILREHYPANVELYFIAGADAISSIAHWKNAAEMGALARFVGVDRPGYELSEAQRMAIIQEAQGITLSFITIEAIALSSSELRKRMEAGKSIRYLTPRVVADYIACHSLYTGGEVSCG